MGIRLEPEEIEKLWQGYERDDPFQETDWDAIVALAAQKKLLEELEKPCPHRTVANGFLYSYPKFTCTNCMAEIKKEVLG